MGVTNIPMLNADIVTVSIPDASLHCIPLHTWIQNNSFGTYYIQHTLCHLKCNAKLKQTNRRTYEAALTLEPPAYAFFKVVLPDIMPGIFSGFLLSFTMSPDDFVDHAFHKRSWY